MSKREDIMEKYPDENFLFADGLDEAIIGVDANTFNSPPRIVYSRSRCIEILARDMEVKKSDLEKGQTIKQKKHEMATEFFEFNVSGAYLGKSTPIWVDDEI